MGSAEPCPVSNRPVGRLSRRGRRLQDTASMGEASGDLAGRDSAELLAPVRRHQRRVSGNFTPPAMSSNHYKRKQLIVFTFYLRHGNCSTMILYTVAFDMSLI
jgi:hypothetical protein